jgi:hypothetical protein
MECKNITFNGICKIFLEISFTAQDRLICNAYVRKTNNALQLRREPGLLCNYKLLVLFCAILNIPYGD